MSKQLLFHAEAREKLLRGATLLADAVRVTLGPKSKSVLLEKQWGRPLVCNDGVTIAKEVELKDAEENQNVQLTPHFKLHQFLCKQQSGFPKYVVLRERLLLKLETLLSEVNRAGFRTDTFHVMSGYRTPHYNQQIENVRYSRHVFGDASDIFFPEDSPVVLREPKLEQVTLLSRFIEALEAEPSFRRFIGGMGRYQKTAAHPPFVHIDARGWPARW